MSTLSTINEQFLELHTSKEDAFWIDKMGLESVEPIDFAENEMELRTFAADPNNLAIVRKELESDALTETERLAFTGWERYFAANQIEGDEGKELYRDIVEREGILERERGSMKLGYVDPSTDKFVEASSVTLGLRMRTSPEEADRKSAYQGLRSIERFVLEHGFLDIVKRRNRLAKMLGYEDYYDWKVTINEGFGKHRLFQILDDLEVKTREVCKVSVDYVSQNFGSSGIEPWNWAYATLGDLTAQLDPYFPFEESFDRWGRSFAAMGITYHGATLKLDLVDRKGKYSNGFMHGPEPAWIEGDQLHPARINFTANALPGKVGSGQRGTETFFHEGGHAAHFSNVKMPAPCFAQEYSPTSVALAETQSMFLDALLGDADWLFKYARTKSGEQIPVELVTKGIVEKSRFRASRLRAMLAVSYTEKALYEMSEEELTAENVLSSVRRIEKELSLINGAPSPILAIPHLISGEASAYYHGYILAEMAVYQTREFFIRRDGSIADNPNVGPTLAESYWRIGNGRPFPELVEELTGFPFSADATARVVTKSEAALRQEVDFAWSNCEGNTGYSAKVELNANISVVHGPEEIATTIGSGFESASSQFRSWIQSIL